MTHESEPGSGGVRSESASVPARRGEREAHALSPEEEPTTTGTLFIMILFLMALGAMWGLMYFTLLGR